MAIISKVSNKLKYLNKLKTRLLITYLFIGIMPLILFIMVLVDAYVDKAIEQRIKQLKLQCIIISNQLEFSGYMNNLTEEFYKDEIEQLLNDIDGRIILINNDFKVIQDTNKLEIGKYIVTEKVMKAVGMNESSSMYDKKDNYLELTMPIIKSNTNESLGVMVISTSISDIIIGADELKRKALILTIAATIIIVVFALYFATILTRPLKKLSDSINKISEGYLDEELVVKGYTEINRISDAFNKMTNKLQALETSRQEFVSNVSHELKTPITSMKVLADSLLMQDNVPEEMYKEFMQDITEEVERENKIITDLLSLVKMDKTSINLNIEPVNMNELMELILKRLRPIAARKNIELVFESFRPVIVEIDEVKMTLAISNLIENAIKYNVDDGWVRVSLNADHKFMFIKVSDSGIGIPEEAQEHIFDRFYRVDKARSRETGGTGLGLAITRGAIIMHKGAIKVYSKEDEGTTFTTRIPLTYVH